MKCCCVLFSLGGHTAEMLSLLSVLRKDRFTPRFYIAAATDNMSLQKARSFEDSVAEKVLVKSLISISFEFLSFLFGFCRFSLIVVVR